jgi:hypothetical protein
VRLGQAAFKALVQEAYTAAAQSPETKTVPVLQAAHIRPVTEEGENRVDNGLLLRSDVHTLFDRGYLGVHPDRNTLPVSLYDGVITTNSSTFDIDHVVAIEEAWTSGAWAWTTARRTAYANDLATRSRSRRSAPVATAARAIGTRPSGCRERNVCSYAVRWVAIKYRWSLTIHTAEKRELAHLFAGTCGTARISVPPAGH